MLVGFGRIDLNPHSFAILANAAPARQDWESSARMSVLQKYGDLMLLNERAFVDLPLK
jgi:hypothetical protein